MPCNPVYVIIKYTEEKYMLFLNTYICSKSPKDMWNNTYQLEKLSQGEDRVET